MNMSRSRLSPLTVGVVLIVLLISAPKSCTAQSVAAAKAFSSPAAANDKCALLAKEKGLVVSSDADRLTCQAKPGEWIQVSFVVHESYPARQIISEIKSQLTHAGWKPLKEDWLNPGISSAPARGWSQYVEETGGTLRDYWTWKAGWQNANGDLIEYTLLYSRPFRTKGPLSDVSINGNWMSAAKAQADRDFVKRARENSAKRGER